MIYKQILEIDIKKKKRILILKLKIGLDLKIKNFISNFYINEKNVLFFQINAMKI